MVILFVVVDDHVLCGSRSRMRCPTMNVQWPEVTCNFLLLLETNVPEILIPEYESSSLRSVQGELIETGRTQLR